MQNVRFQIQTITVRSEKEYFSFNLKKEHKKLIGFFCDTSSLQLKLNINDVEVVSLPFSTNVCARGAAFYRGWKNIFLPVNMNIDFAEVNGTIAYYKSQSPYHYKTFPFDVNLYFIFEK